MERKGDTEKAAVESDNEEDEEEAALRQAIEEEEAANEQRDDIIAAQNVILAVSEKEDQEPVFAPNSVDIRIQRIDEQIAMMEQEKKETISVVDVAGPAAPSAGSHEAEKRVFNFPAYK